MNRPDYNVYNANCPTRKALEHISDKWTILIIYALNDHPTRFNQLKNMIEGISHKMLTQTLRKLERDGLVTRKVNPQAIPISVTYDLTPAGKGLSGPAAGLKAWAEEYIEIVEAAQKTYDSTQKSLIA